MKFRFRPFLLCLPFFLACGAAIGAEGSFGAPVSADGQGVWIRVAPGARPAYVGIQGGTATLSLNVTPDGSIITYTGTSGNDFTKILHAAPPAPAEAPDTHSPASSPVPNPLRAANEHAFLPIGLDGHSGETAAAPAGTREIKTAATRPFKPLKLGSYKQMLRRPGKV